MTHQPPVPEAATPPWPATPAPREHAPEPPAADNDDGARVSKQAVAVAAGVAVGSAAVAAALLFAGRISKPKSASAPRAHPAAAKKPSASDIKVG